MVTPPNADGILTDKEVGNSDIAIVDNLPIDVIGETVVHTAVADECVKELSRKQQPPPPIHPKAV